MDDPVPVIQLWFYMLVLSPCTEGHPLSSTETLRNCSYNNCPARRGSNNRKPHHTYMDTIHQLL